MAPPNKECAASGLSGAAFSVWRVECGVWSCVSRTNAFPRGEGAPVRTLGRMRNGERFRFRMYQDKMEPTVRLAPRLPTLLQGNTCRQSSSDLTGARPPVNYGMIATGNHWNSDSLRGAPPLGEGIDPLKNNLVNFANEILFNIRTPFGRNPEGHFV